MRFGTFEVDLRARELRQRGATIKLQDQPFRVLAALLERPGDVVTREQIRERLWPSDTFVDFEHGLNSAIKKLRQALRDDAESPRFIETLPKRGYRFIAPVSAEFLGVVDSASHDAVTAAPDAVTVTPRPTTSRFRVAAAVTAGVLLVAAVALFASRSAMLHRNDALAGGAAFRSIAVLPFVNLSSDAAQEYFSDGMTDELITDLAKTRGLLVISHTSVLRYKRTTLPLPAIARELGVEAVVEGSVTRSGDRVRITAQLIDTRSDRHLWAESYERDVHDVLTIQDELAQRIARTVGLTLAAGRAAAAPRTSPAAYEAYLKGNFYWNRLTCDGFKRAAAYYQQAVDEDSGYAQAHAGLAQAYFTRWDWGCDSGTGTILKSKAEALEAIRLDPNLAEAHAWLGKALFFFDWNYSQAQEEITQAIDLNPSYEHAHSMLAVLSVARGRPEQGLAEMKRALELDPTSEISNVVATYLFYLTRQYDRAIEQGKRTIELYPNSPAPYVWLGATYEQKRMYAEAGDAYLTEKTLRGVPATSVQASRNAYQLSGIHGYWERELASAKAAHGHACWIATIESHLGDKQEALESLAPALQQHCSGLHALSVDPVFDPLRGDPRFKEIEARLNQ